MASGNNNSVKSQLQNSNVYSPMASLAFKFSFFFGIVGLSFLIIFSIGEAYTLKKFFDILGIVIVTAFASIAGGGIVGFLFGIPHTIQQNALINSLNSANLGPSGAVVNPSGLTTSSQNVTATPSPSSLNQTRQQKSNYTPSTNLEQIADWLTKIIVGVSLIEIHKIIKLFNQLCLALGNTLQHYSATNQNGSLVIGCIIILFSIEGFLIVYLWTYVYLIRIQDAMSASDIIDTITLKLNDADQNDKVAIDLASKQLALQDGVADLQVYDLAQAFQNASKNVLSTVFFKAVAIRQQFWNNVNTKFKIEKTIPIFQALIKVSSEFPANYAELAFVLKDKRTPDYKQALDNLSVAIGGFKDDDNITNKAMIYFNRAYCRIKLDSNFINKTPSNADDKKLISEDLTQATKEAYVAAIIARDPIDTTINDWKALNP